MVSFPYHSHVRIPKDMGIVWEAYHEGVPCPWGSLESPLTQRGWPVKWSWVDLWVALASYPPTLRVGSPGKGNFFAGHQQKKCISLYIYNYIIYIYILYYFFLESRKLISIKLFEKKSKLDSGGNLRTSNLSIHQIQGFPGSNRALRNLLADKEQAHL